MPPDAASRSRRAWNLLVITVFALLGAANVVQDVIGFSKLWIIGPGLASVVAYLGLARPPAEGRWRSWGVRWDNAGAALAGYGSSTLVLGAGMLGSALAMGRPPRFGTFGLLAAVYPVWAFAQQFCFQVVLREAADGLGIPDRAKIAGIAILFAAVHAPDVPLVGLTLAMGAAWTWMYGKVPNLPALALSHGILGSATYLWVLGRDPLAELGIGSPAL
jgi:membrane protease YdiL (CAAX protease family)